MKKVWVLLVALSVLVLAACANKNPMPSPESSLAQQTEDNIEDGAGPRSQAEGGYSASPSPQDSESEKQDQSSSPSASPSPSKSGASSDSAPSAPSESASPSLSDSSAATESAPPSPTANPQKRPNSVTPPKAAPAVDTITISVIGNDKWGTIVGQESVTLKDGDTAASVLKRTAKAHRLAYEIRGSGDMTYVKGIDGLYEFDDGPTSGWKYRVNGKVLDIGAGSYELKPGDRLEWFYTSEDKAASENKESGK